MANIFWGVSDALDLYGEYISAKEQKIQKHNLLAIKVKAEKEIYSRITGDNKANKNIDYKENTVIDIDSMACNANKEKLEVEELCLKDISDEPEEETVDKAAQTYRVTQSNNRNINDAGKTSCSTKSFYEALTKKTEKISKNIEDNNENPDRLQCIGDNDTTHFKTDEKVLNVIGNINAENFNANHANESKIASECKENITKEVESPKNLEADGENLIRVENKSNKIIEHKNEDEYENEDEEEREKDPKVIKNLNNEINNCVNEKGDCKNENGICKDDLKNINQLVPTEDPKKFVTEKCINFENMDDISLAQEREIAGNDSHSNNGDSCVGPNYVDQATSEKSKPCVLNILIYGAGDPRHIIKTMAKRYTHCEEEGTASTVPILKFFVVEACVELIARNIALLGIALESPDQISLRNKVHLFMDVYGNSLLRPICHQYLVSKAATLLKMVSDKSILQKIAPLIHIDGLRYREMDALQDSFEFWQPKPGYEFNIADSWMSRLRRLLTVRYDARDGVFDWDLNMSLKDRGCEQICSQEYRYWRETGIAFTFPEYEQCKPNKTLSAGLVRNGGRYLHRGYIGDIQTGPFCTFGLRSVEERMHHSAHGENDYRATDITERNLLEYFHEIQKGTAYVHNNSLSHKYGGVRFQMGERLIHNESENMKSICAYDQPWINVEGIEIHFLPLQEVKEIGRGSLKWKEFFDIAFVGYKYFEFLTEAFTEVLNENSLLIFETKLRSVEIKNRIAEFENELHGYARASRLLSVLNYKALNSKNSILKFWKPDKIVQENMKIE